MKHIKHVKCILSANRYIKQIPGYNVFGRKTTLRLNPDKIPDLHWSLADSYHTTNIGLTISNTMTVSTNYIDVNTLSYARGNKYKKWCGVSMSTDVNIVQNNIKPIVCSTIRGTQNNHEKHITGNCISYMDMYCNPLLKDIIHDIPQTVLYSCRVFPLLLASRNNRLK